MEKLQRALNKAREERGERMSGSAAAAARQNAPSRLEPGRHEDYPPVWELLAPFEPDPQHLRSKHVMTLNSQPDAGAFDMLRTKIFMMMRENGWKRLAITSPDKSCGKTTVACNLAVGFSRQREIKTLLFDLDLRCPGVASVMGYKPEHEVRALLTGEIPPEQQMVRLRENVAISMSQRPVSDPPQILLAKQTEAVFNEIEQQFQPELMMFDLPPMLVSDDARAVLKHSDCALIVVRAEQTRSAHFDQCEHEVGEYTNVLGVVLNNCRHLTREDHYYGTYSG